MVHRSSAGATAPLAAVALATAALLIAGCAGNPPPAEPELRLAWPEPPLEPRIRYERMLATEKHLGRQPTRSELFRQFLTGEKPPTSHIYQPMDIAVSDDGRRLYVADFGQLMVFVFDLDSQTVERIGAQRPLARPFGVALDDEQNVYIAEQDARRVLVLDRDHQPIRAITDERLVRPADIAIDRARRRLYVADPAHKVTEHHTVKVFDLDGEFLSEIGRGKGQCEGCLFFPTYVAVDRDGNVYVTSTLSARVDVFDPAGEPLRTIGERGNAFGMFDKPKGIALDAFGNVYVVDSGWSTVQIFNGDGDVLLYFGGRGMHPGLLRNPTGIAIDGDNRIYVADYLNYRVNAYQLVNTTAEDSYPTQPEAAASASTSSAAGGSG